MSTISMDTAIREAYHFISPIRLLYDLDSVKVTPTSIDVGHPMKMRPGLVQATTDVNAYVARVHTEIQGFFAYMRRPSRQDH